MASPTQDSSQVQRPVIVSEPQTVVIHAQQPNSLGVNFGLIRSTYYHLEGAMRGMMTLSTSRAAGRKFTSGLRVTDALLPNINQFLTNKEQYRFHRSSKQYLKKLLSTRCVLPTYPEGNEKERLKKIITRSPELIKLKIESDYLGRHEWDIKPLINLRRSLQVLYISGTTLNLNGTIDTLTQLTALKKLKIWNIRNKGTPSDFGVTILKNVTRFHPLLKDCELTVDVNTMDLNRLIEVKQLDFSEISCMRVDRRSRPDKWETLTCKNLKVVKIGGLSANDRIHHPFNQLGYPTDGPISTIRDFKLITPDPADLLNKKPDLHHPLFHKSDWPLFQIGRKFPELSCLRICVEKRVVVDSFEADYFGDKDITPFYKKLIRLELQCDYFYASELLALKPNFSLCFAALKVLDMTKVVPGNGGSKQESLLKQIQKVQEQCPHLRILLPVWRGKDRNIA